MELFASIASAALIVVLLVILIPRVKAARDASPEGTTSDWMSALIPMALVIGFVVLLMLMV